MAADPGDNKPGKKSLGGDLIIPVAAVAFTLYYFSTILDAPWEAQVNAFFIGTLLIVLVIVFFVASLRSLRRGEAEWSFGLLLAPRWFIPKRLLLLALTLAYIVLLEWGGFTLTSFVFLFAAMYLLNEGRRPLRLLSIAAALALGGYLLFIVAFAVRFPEGPFEKLMATVF